VGCHVYEIYPQSETPQLIQIAQLDFDPSTVAEAHLLPDKVIWSRFCDDRIVFTIWDFRLNHSISFSTERLKYNVEVYYKPINTLKLASDSFIG